MRAAAGNSGNEVQRREVAEPSEDIAKRVPKRGIADLLAALANAEQELGKAKAQTKTTTVTKTVAQTIMQTVTAAAAPAAAAASNQTATANNG